jgi:hypothetical protein
MYGNNALGTTNGDDLRLTSKALIERGVDVWGFALM